MSGDHILFLKKEDTGGNMADTHPSKENGKYRKLKAFRKSECRKMLCCEALTFIMCIHVVLRTACQAQVFSDPVLIVVYLICLFSWIFIFWIQPIVTCFPCVFLSLFLTTILPLYIVNISLVSKTLFAYTCSQLHPTYLTGVQSKLFSLLILWLNP